MSHLLLTAHLSHYIHYSAMALVIAIWTVSTFQKLLEQLYREICSLAVYVNSIQRRWILQCLILPLGMGEWYYYMSYIRLSNAALAIIIYFRTHRPGSAKKRNPVRGVSVVVLARTALVCCSYKSLEKNHSVTWRVLQMMNWQLLPRKISTTPDTMTQEFTRH